MSNASHSKPIKSQARGGKGIKASDSKDDDFVEHLFAASTHDDLLCFTDTGRVFKIKVYELPEMSRTIQGSTHHQLHRSQARRAHLCIPRHQ